MDKPAVNDPHYWYVNRHDLGSGMVFRTNEGELVQLDRSVPGDGTKWYVANWCVDHWSFEDGTIEPGDLRGDALPDPARDSPVDSGHSFKM